MGTVDRARLAGEAEELVDALGVRLLSLEAEGASREVLDEIFRGVHTIKGLAVSVGNTPVARVAHGVESLLESCASLPDLPPLVLDLVHEAAELFARELSNLGERRRAATEVVEDLCARLDAATRPATEDTAETTRRVALGGVDPELLAVLRKRERQHLQEALSAGKPVLRVLMAWSPQALRSGIARVKSALREHGETISMVPGPDLPNDDIRFDAVIATTASAGKLTAAATAVGARVVSVEPVVKTQSRDAELVRGSSRTVRVDVRKVDALLGAVGELSALAASIGTVEAGLRHGGAVKAADRLASDLVQLSDHIVELQHGLIGIRMVALKPMMARLGRVARRIAQSSAKRVRLEVSGAQTEVDKVIVEELSEPLLHLIRNAIDHGIEPEAERRAAGKPAEGTIRIGARQDGSQLVVELSDNGRGVDLEKVRQLAVAHQVVGPERAAELGEREVLELLFHSGFSTRDEADLVSGRGVGLDAVRASIGRLGGVIGITSEPGEGVRFHIRVPITLAMVHGILVEISGRTFAMPVSGVVESAPIDVAALDGPGPAFRIPFRKGALPVYRVADVLGMDPPDGSMVVVVTGVGSGRLGLLVDKIVGAQDIVVKPMPKALSAVGCVAGAAELGGRQTVLVLDVPALVAEARDRSGGK